MKDFHDLTSYEATANSLMKKGGVLLHRHSSHDFILSEYSSDEGFVRIMLRVVGSLSLPRCTRIYASDVSVIVLRI